jgi:predicted glycogen debranching enzyme
MEGLFFSVPGSTQNQAELDKLLSSEWLVANGLGGYASGTVCGVRTSRYHGLLIAALPSPLGRVVMLNDLKEEIEFPNGTSIRLGAENTAGQPLTFHSMDFVSEFRLETGLPVWRYTAGDYVLEKRLVLPHMQNTVYIVYALIKGEGDIRVHLSPQVNFRFHGDAVNSEMGATYAMTVMEDRYELGAGPRKPVLRFKLYGDNAAFTFRSDRINDLVFWLEEQRGFYEKGFLWSPGTFHMDLRKAQRATMVASTHSWETMLALYPEEALDSEYRRREGLISQAAPEARKGPGRDLILAADQFVIRPMGRPQDAARARASGYDVHTVIAGYHWFTDWGRDTMISLEGLTLVTGRFVEAGSILRTFSHYIRGGLIPNMFPEGEKEGLYNTADATLWFFHAIDRYLSYTQDRSTMVLVLPKLVNIVESHLKGTSFNIKVDPEDGLLSQGEKSYQLTWMDAKVDDWVVTPRRGKTVEINALWYNALRLLEKWLREEGYADRAEFCGKQADKAYKSFNEKFWNENGGYLYDVIDGEEGNDNACRPNQVFAISLEHPILHPSRWEPVLSVVKDRLLTPKGLRSLAPGHPDYKSKYFGDLRSRDAAYHQGTVWAWLIGPYLDAWLKTHPDDLEEAHQVLRTLISELNLTGIGFISEIFDADYPFTARGCIAQAWSVAEALRCWVQLHSAQRP